MTSRVVSQQRPDDENHGWYVIATVARVEGIDPSAVRRYERAGLIHSKRRQGNIPLFNSSDIEELRRIQRLSRELGLSVAAIDVILHMRRQIVALQEEITILRNR